MNRDCQEQYDMLSPGEKKMLHMWINFINTHHQDQRDEWIAKPDDFFSTEWRETFSIATVEVGWHNIVTMSAGTGDDGGPAILTAWIVAPGYPGGDDNDPLIAALAYDFDATVTVPYTSEGGWSNWPEGVPTPSDA